MLPLPYRNKESPLALDKYINSLREFQLELQLFSLTAAGAVYATKLLFMAMAVMGFFIVIRYGTELPVLVLMVNIVMASVGVFMYNFMYDVAVWMPSRFEQVMHELKVQIDRSFERRLLRLRLTSIPRLGMSVGSFHSFERTTRLEYVDFVVGQVVNLLITFR